MHKSVAYCFPIYLRMVSSFISQYTQHIIANIQLYVYTDIITFISSWNQVNTRDESKKEEEEDKKKENNSTRTYVDVFFVFNWVWFILLLFDCLEINSLQHRAENIFRRHHRHQVYDEKTMLLNSFVNFDWRIYSICWKWILSRESIYRHFVQSTEHSWMLLIVLSLKVNVAHDVATVQILFFGSMHHGRWSTESNAQILITISIDHLRMATITKIFFYGEQKFVISSKWMDFY